MSNPIEIQFQQIHTELKRLDVIKNNYGELLNIPNFRDEVQAFYDNVAKQMYVWLGKTKNALVEEGLDRLKEVATEVAIINATKPTDVKEVSVEIPFSFKHEGVYVDTEKMETLNAIYEKISGDPLLNVELIFATRGINCRRTENGFKLSARVAK